MKLWKYLPMLFFLSCIDLFIQETQYNSLYFQGGSWIEMERIDSMKLESNDFTLQFWVSGGEVDTNEAPALFSLIDSSDKITLALLRDPNQQNKITTVINSQFSKHEMSELDWSDSENFYLISLLFSDTSGVKMYLDNSIFLDVDSLINLEGEKLIISAMANKERTILENFWYGYIDEVRLWNTLLADSTIKFQSEHPDKIGEYYRYTDENGKEIATYLDSLIGIWRLNFEEIPSAIEDDSAYDNDGIIYTLTDYSVELSKKGAQ